jgi:hypothetical protein
MATMNDGDERTLLVSGLWLHGGLIGAAVAGAGVLQWCTGDLGAISALGLVFSGALVAAACWRRGWVVLRNAVRDTLPHAAASAACHPANRSCAGARELGKAVFEGEAV